MTNPQPRKKEPLERELALQAGVGMMLAGNSKRWSADMMGVARTTLFDKYQKMLGPENPDRAVQIAKASESLVAGAFAVAMRCFTLIDQRLDSGDMDTRDVISSLNSSTACLDRVLGWSKGRATDPGEGKGLDRVAEALMSMRGESRMTLTLEPADKPEREEKVIEHEPAAG